MLALFITALKIDQKAKLDTINCEALYCVMIPFWLTVSKVMNLKILMY